METIIPVGAEDFPGLLSYKAFLDTAAISLAPKTARDTILSAIADYFLDPPAAEGRVLEELERSMMLLGEVFGWDPERIGFGESTTHMIVRVATALAGPGGVIAASNHEFPGIILALRSACRRLGCTVRVYEAGTPEEALLEGLEDGASVLVGSTVYWVTGHRLDTSRIVPKARARGAYTVLDVIQHLGGPMLGEHDLEADALCAASKKWLLAPHSGLAVCHLSGRALGHEPPWYGLNNSDIPDRQAYWADPAKPRQELLPLRSDGHRYTAPSGIQYLHALALRATLEYHARLDRRKVDQHITSLARIIVEEATRAGFETPEPEPGSGIVLIQTGLPFEREAKIAERLRSEGIRISHRGQAGIHGIRASVHIYNNTEDVEKLIRRLKELARP